MSAGYDIVPDLAAFVRSSATASRTVRLRRVVATVLLLEHPDDSALVRALGPEVVRVEESLLLRLYRAADPRMRRMLVSGPAMRRLRPRVFAMVWTEARRNARSDSQQAALGSALAAYLRLWPKGVRHFRRDVWSYLHSGRAILRVRGLELAGTMDGLRPEDQAVIERSLNARNPFIRMAALFGIYTMASKRAELPRSMRMLVTSPAIRDTVHALAASDRDKDVRLGARNCMNAIAHAT